MSTIQPDHYWQIFPRRVLWRINIEIQTIFAWRSSFFRRIHRSFRASWQLHRTSFKATSIQYTFPCIGFDRRKKSSFSNWRFRKWNPQKFIYTVNVYSLHFPFCCLDDWTSHLSNSFRKLTVNIDAHWKTFFATSKILSLAILINDSFSIVSPIDK